MDDLSIIPDLPAVPTDFSLTDADLRFITLYGEPKTRKLNTLSYTPGSESFSLFPENIPTKFFPVDNEANESSSVPILRIYDQNKKITEKAIYTHLKIKHPDTPTCFLEFPGPLEDHTAPRQYTLCCLDYQETPLKVEVFQTVKLEPKAIAELVLKGQLARKYENFATFEINDPLGKTLVIESTSEANFNKQYKQTEPGRVITTTKFQ